MNMKNEIIASISVFGAYRENHKDAYDIVADFSKAALALKRPAKFTAEVMQDYLAELFSIEIPIGVIRGVLKKRLGDAITKCSDGYTVNEIPDDKISDEVKATKEAYEAILGKLLEFLNSSAPQTVLSKYQDSEIIEQFAIFIMDDNADEALSTYFESFVVANKDDKTFTSYFERLSSGLIGYYGIRYFDNTNNVGSWTKDSKLTIYLDTEFLFNCAEYNDSYYKKVYDELNDLVSEINRPYRDKPVIQIKFLAETKTAFDGVFINAKDLLEKKQAPDLSKEALLKIVHESHSTLDVDTHKAQILSKVKSLGIIYDDNDYSSFATDPRYITFGKEEYTKYSENFSSEGSDNVENKINYYTKILTTINGLRGGQAKQSFDNCRFIFLTNSRIGHCIAYDQSINNNKAVPLATDIDWLVSRFWYKLNKSFSTSRIPLSLDIVARSQAALSEEVCSKLKQRFDDIKKKNLPDDVKKELYAEMRTIPKEIELYDSNSLPEILDFISYEDTEAFITAQYKLKETAAKSEENELRAKESEEKLVSAEKNISEYAKANQELKRELRHEKHKPLVIKIKRRTILRRILYYFLLTLIIGIIAFIEYKAVASSNIWTIFVSSIVDLVVIVGYIIKGHKKLYCHVSFIATACSYLRKHVVK